VRSCQTEESRKRVIEVISRVRDIQKRIKLSPVRFRAPCSELPNVPAEFKQLNRMLERYRSRPQFFVHPGRREGWDVDDAPVLKSCPSGEWLAVDGVLRLAKANRLDRLQTCACGKWYFAKFSHQRFCSTECRVKFWESSDERKEQKRKKAREYYEFHKVHERK